MNDFTVKQRNYNHTLMDLFDLQLKEILTPGFGQNNWMTILEEKLDQSSTLTSATSAVIGAAVTLAPVSGGTSLVAAAGALGAVGAGLILSKMLVGGIRVLHTQSAEEHQSEKQYFAWFTEFQILADDLTVQLRQIIEEVLEENSINTLA